MIYLVVLSLATVVQGETPSPAPVAIPPALDMPSYEEPAQPWAEVQEEAERLRCQKTIEQVRGEPIEPNLERGPATGDDGMMIAAVDKRIHGCPVVVMHNDKSDLRPAPKVELRQAQIVPAAGR